MNISNKSLIIVGLLSLILPIYLHAQVKLPAIFSDHMVIQRNLPLKVWGWAEKGENIVVSLNGATVSTKADKAGNWQATLPAFTQGGPYQLEVKGKNTITLKDILIGDVWFCSGQSNMDMTVANSKNATAELKDVNYPTIRLFNVPNEMNEQPQKDFKKGSWLTCNSETVQNFSAVGFFFGRILNKDLNVPIGLIKSSWGGTEIQPWMSSDAISEFKNYLPALAELKTKNYEQLTKERDRRQVEWNDTLLNLESGTVNKWYLPETDDNDWTKIYVPAVWQSVGIKGNGVGWFRKEFDLNEKEASNNVLFFLGIIHNAEETYLNGVKIGKSDDYNRPRIYAATPSILRKGKNVLAVKVYNYWGDGGFISKAEDLYYQTKTENKPLSGPWKFKIGYFSPNPDVVINRNNYPTLLYNTMVNPLVRFPIKGVLWYQGENNVGKAVEYRNLLPAMIMDWRKQWNIGDFPFLIVQLTNIQKSDDFPVESVWAQLREAQASSLTLSNTGLAVTIDIGEADNIHAKNKQDVGYRLSLAARKIAYGEDIIYSGPTLKSFKMEGNKAIIEFDNIGSGLVSNDKYGYVKGFSIAGPDHKFYWAKAEIKDNKVMVSSEKVNSPVAIRYAWGNNPDASLYNIEKLPCVPFRTDNW